MLPSSKGAVGHCVTFTGLGACFMTKSVHRNTLGNEELQRAMVIDFECPLLLPRHKPGPCLGSLNWTALRPVTPIRPVLQRKQGGATAERSVFAGVFAVYGKKERGIACVEKIGEMKAIVKHRDSTVSAMVFVDAIIC